MSSFLIDRHSPIRSVSDLSSSRTKLHHRSRHQSESDSTNINSTNSNSKDSPQRQHQQPEGKAKAGAGKEDDSPEIKAQNVKGPSMFSYFKSELTRNYKLEGDASEFVQRRDRIYVSVNTPKSLEKFCAFGLLQCLDSILNIMTFLPLRILVCLMHVLTYPCSVMFLKKKAILNPAQICDLLKGVVLIVSCLITSYIDTSMVYHIVRTQSTIKFYVIYNMLDVMDKLVSGFGQDVLDSLYWTAVEPRGRRREHFGAIFHLMFAIAYVVIHTTLILIQAITLNVAFNSHNKNLLTIMLSNNFIEIKSNLFKRLDKNTLCQITYFDVKERFHYFILLLFILIHNLMEKNWLRDQASIYFVDALIVLGAEVIVDWIKHSFITKINEFSPSFYHDFAVGLAQDIATSQKKHAFTDFSDQVCRRMGFTPIPLICLLYMVCRKSFEITGLLSWSVVFMLYLCLFTTKVLNSIILLGWAQHLITHGDKNAKSTGTVGNSQILPKKEDKKSEKRVKTESISHCPDMTSQLSQTVLTPQYPATHNESEASFQAPSDAFTSSPLPQTHQSYISSTTNPISEIAAQLGGSLHANGDRVSEDNSDETSVAHHHIADLHQNGKNSTAISENDWPQSATDSNKESAVDEDKQLFDQRESLEDARDDLYDILLDDISGSSIPLVYDSGMSLSTFSPVVTSVSEPSNRESLSSLPSQQVSTEEAHEPFMLKLSSSLPERCQTKNSDFPSQRSVLHSHHSSSLNAVAAPLSSRNAAPTDGSSSSGSQLLRKENTEKSPSPEKFTDL